MIEHRPWMGKNYQVGLRGQSNQRVMIMGYSHHRDDDDHNGFTEDVLADVISGKKYAFFTKIRNYFDFEDHEEFWNQVIFMNYLPDCIGLAKDRYGRGGGIQNKRAAARLLKTIEERLPHKVFVFTMKGWKSMPECDENNIGRPCISLGPSFPSSYEYGTYSAGSHKAVAYGLNHPERAIGAMQKGAVSFILKMANSP